MAKLSTVEVQCFRQIYEDNQLFVRKSLYWITGLETVDDIVQEVFIKVWKALPKFKGESSVKTWIYRITMNCAYDHLKKEKRKSERVEQGSNESSSSPEGELIVEKIVQEAFRQLTEKQQEAFLLFYIQGMSVEEVAKTADVAEGTVKSRLASSREVMEQTLAKHGVKL